MRSVCFAACCADGQAATADPGLVTLAPLLTHCCRQLGQFIPEKEPHAHTPHAILSHPQNDVLSFKSRPASVVQLVPQLPALLALSLALPHSTHSMRSVHSMHSTAESEGETHVQTALLLQPYLLLKDSKLPKTHRWCMSVCSANAWQPNSYTPLSWSILSRCLSLQGNAISASLQPRLTSSAWFSPPFGSPRGT